MTMLTRIGNSQGVRIPKPFIAGANLENHELDFEIVDNGLLIKPISTKRDNWKENMVPSHNQWVNFHLNFLKPTIYQ